MSDLRICKHPGAGKREKEREIESGRERERALNRSCKDNMHDNTLSDEYVIISISIINMFNLLV